MTEHYPDNFKIIKVETDNGDFLHKVFATWRGGYLHGDSWRANSGISKIKEDNSYFHFYGKSGSVYTCHKESYGSCFYTENVLQNFKERAKGRFEILGEEEAIEYIEGAL